MPPAATSGVCSYLVGAGADPKAAPAQVLLLLRSAVKRREPLDPWLGWPDAPATKALITQLETPRVPVASENRASGTTLEKGAQLLGASLPEPAETDAETEEKFGVVARAAVAAKAESSVGELAALALTALSPSEAVDRLRWALEAEPGGWRKDLRRIELRAR